jgi:hypothetical protein
MQFFALVPILVVRLVCDGLYGIATNLFAYINYELAILFSYNKLQYKKYDVCASQGTNRDTCY